MVGIEVHVESGVLVAGGRFGDDRHLFLVRSALERVAQPQQPGGDGAADHAAAEAVHWSFWRDVACVVVPVGGLAAAVRIPDRLLDGHERSGTCRRTMRQW
jgi:hypothetical protein